MYSRVPVCVCVMMFVGKSRAASQWINVKKSVVESNPIGDHLQLAPRVVTFISPGLWCRCAITLPLGYYLPLSFSSSLGIFNDNVLFFRYQKQGSRKIDMLRSKCTQKRNSDSRNHCQVYWLYEDDPRKTEISTKIAINICATN